MDRLRIGFSCSLLAFAHIAETLVFTHIRCTLKVPTSLRTRNSLGKGSPGLQNVDLLHYHLYLGFVHPLQDVALHQCLPLSSVCCFPNPGGSILSLLCHLAIFCLVILSTSFLSLVATLCIALSIYCPLVLLYDRPISTFVSM